MHYMPSTVPDEAVEALRPAFAHSYSGTPEEWIQRCRDDLAQLWRVGRSWAITQIMDVQGIRIIHCKALAGEFNEAIKSEMEAFGRKHGCKKAIYEGRIGWMRKNRDYKTLAAMMEKEL